MFNCNLAASGNVSVSQPQRARQLADNVRRVCSNVISAVKSLDRRAQSFFNTQASVRSRKVTKPKCGWQRYDGFN